jgi:hypothetical protein
MNRELQFTIAAYLKDMKDRGDNEAEKLLALMEKEEDVTKHINTMVDFLINDGDMGCLPNMCDDGSGWVAYQAALKFKKLRKENE